MSIIRAYISVVTKAYIRAVIPSNGSGNDIPSDGFWLMEDGTSYALAEDGVSKIESETVTP